MKSEHKHEHELVIENRDFGLYTVMIAQQYYSVI